MTFIKPKGKAGDKEMKPITVTIIGSFSEVKHLMQRATDESKVIE